MPESHETLSEEEVKALEEALGDGITSLGFPVSNETQIVDISSRFPNPLFGSQIRFPRDEWVRLGIGEDHDIGNFSLDDNDDLMDEYDPEDAPTWYEVNPFRFNLENIRSHFMALVEASRQKFKKENPEGVEYFTLLYASEDLTQEDIDAFIDGAILDQHASQSKVWFEIQIAKEIQYAIDRLSAPRVAGSGLTLHSLLIASSLGRLGRMVEHYRWRFRYERDALRGIKNLSSARSGGAERSKTSSTASRLILAKMETYISSGHSVSRAAKHAHKAGLGKSPEANRKLWQRHKAK